RRNRVQPLHHPQPVTRRGGCSRGCTALPHNQTQPRVSRPRGAGKIAQRLQAMPTRLRRLLLFGAPTLVAAFNLAHSVIPQPVYAGVLHPLDWWVTLHLVNLLLFPLLGLAAYTLTGELKGAAATVSRVAIAFFIPV